MSRTEVVAIVRTTPEQAEKAAAIIRKCVAPSREESANDGYMACRDVDNAGTFVFVESWASREALNAHMATPHFRALTAELEPLLTAPLQVHILSPL